MNDIFKALGDLNRLRILHLLFHDELCVSDLEDVLKLTQSNVSRHLGKLKSVGIITPNKTAQWVSYRVSDQFLTDNQELVAFLHKSFEMDETYTEDFNNLIEMRKVKPCCSSDLKSVRS